MKKKLLTLLFLFLVTHINGQDNKDISSIIKEQMNVLHNVDSILLEHLPSTFHDYVLLWGEADSPLSDYPSVVEHLSHSQQIDYNRFIERIVDISVGASPGVDHIYYLQSVTKTLVEYNLRQVVVCLNKKSKEENLQFWSFVFGGIEDCASVAKKNHIIHRTQRLKSHTFIGYLYIETIDSGYQEAIRYIEHH